MRDRGVFFLRFSNSGDLRRRPSSHDDGNGGDRASQWPTHPEVEDELPPVEPVSLVVPLPVGSPVEVGGLTCWVVVGGVATGSLVDPLDELPEDELPEESLPDELLEEPLPEVLPDVELPDDELPEELLPDEELPEDEVLPVLTVAPAGWRRY